MQNQFHQPSQSEPGSRWIRYPTQGPRSRQSLTDCQATTERISPSESRKVCALRQTVSALRLENRMVIGSHCLAPELPPQGLAELSKICVRRARRISRQLLAGFQPGPQVAHGTIQERQPVRLQSRLQFLEEGVRLCGIASPKVPFNP